MKKIIALTAVASLLLTGCISTRSSVNNGLSVLETENKRVEDNQARFALTIPEGFDLEFIDENEQSTGRLLGVKPTEETIEESVMLIEETPVEIEPIITEILKTGAVRESGRSTIMLGEYEGLVMDIVFTETGNRSQYIFVRPSNRTYIFSLPSGDPWGYFFSVVETYEFLKEAPAAPPVAQDSAPTPELEIQDFQVN